MRRMGALRCCASHQLVSALTMSAMHRMVSEISGRLNAPNMLGRRGTRSTVNTPPSAPKICGAARDDLRLTNSSRLKNCRRRGAALQFRRLVLARRDGEGNGDAAADDERHRDHEQHEDPQKKTMHGPR